MLDVNIFDMLRFMPKWHGDGPSELSDGTAGRVVGGAPSVGVSCGAGSNGRSVDCPGPRKAIESWIRPC